MNTVEGAPRHYQSCYRDGWGVVRRGAVVYLTTEEYRARVEMMRQVVSGWLEPVPAPPGEETPEARRATLTARLSARQKALSDELAEVNRQLNLLGANDG